ncbi:MAG: ABC transporter ATP-binding protein [Nitrospirota bacterium]|nr:ABC transporter ATP-binding protein [Nitrospirota bacterium]
MAQHSKEGSTEGSSKAATAPAVETRDLTKRFGATLAVDRLSFRIGRGEIYGLLGANGAGKTTTIAMLLNLITPTSGSLSVLGHSYPAGRQAILSRVNFSSTYVSVPLRLTVWENLRVFAALYSVKNPRERILELLERFEIPDTLHKPVGDLSSGQKTRVYLAKALLNRPEVLFLDEPTASLDPDMADKTRQVIRDIRRDYGTAVLITSHNMAEMESLCDRILFIERGRRLTEGTPREILAQYGRDTLEEVFIHVARNGAADAGTASGVDRGGTP